MRFFKYHALGNDYLVLGLDPSTPVPTAEFARRICHRHFGTGPTVYCCRHQPKTRLDSEYASSIRTDRRRRKVGMACEFLPATCGIKVS